MTRQVPGPSIGLTDRDVFVLTLHHEAGGEGRQGMVAVGAVILNRAAWGQAGGPYGATVRDVCLWPAQFSCWRPVGGPENFGALVLNANAIRAGRRPTALRRADEIAGALLDGAADPTGGADHYYAPAAMKPAGRVPSWAVGRAPTAVLGRHRFYRLRPPVTPEVTDPTGGPTA